MHEMSMFAKVRRLFHRDHLTISEIQRRTSLSRNTIKAWLKETKSATHKYPKRPKVNGKLTPFTPSLILALEADARRPKRDRRTALMLFEAIKKEGYTGSYSILTDYVRDWRNGLTTSSKSAYVPLKFELGEAFQFDWSSASTGFRDIKNQPSMADFSAPPVRVCLRWPSSVLRRSFRPNKGSSLSATMTLRRFAMPCSFPNRKTARRYG